MHRFFSAFPGRGPGFGLLLLRVAAGVSTILQASHYLIAKDSPSLITMLAALIAAAGGAFLVAGSWTPVACALVGIYAVAESFSWFPAPSPNLLESRLAAILLVSIAVALAPLGPGAFSLDARMFGRREIVIPPSHPKATS